MLKRSLFVSVLLSSLGLAASLGQSLQSMNSQKLHPAFQQIVAGETAGSVLNVTKSGPQGLAKEGETLYDAIITTTNADAVRGIGIHINSVVGKFATAVVNRQDLLKLAQLNEVDYIDPGSTNHPMLDLSVPETGANLLQGGFLKSTRYTGKGVIVVIYDTGIDWRHLDFRDPTDTTKSRILAIWDQTIFPTTGESFPSGFSYGVEYSKQQIEAELKGNPPGFVRERDIAGHGTHVAGIAAGNGASYFRRYTGMAPEADIIVIKGGDDTFSESRMIDGLTYAANKSTGSGEPVVVNWSIGGHSGPHDGTRPYELQVNDFVRTEGRVVAISAGNEGADIMHTSGTLSQAGSTTISVTVPTYTPTAGTDNDKFELDVWLRNNATLTATVTSPSNITYSINSSQGSGTASNAADGTIDLFNQVSGINNNRTVQLVVHDRSSNVPKSGVWTLTLSSPSAAADFDAWLSSASVGSATATIFNGNSNKTVAMPATAEGAISVSSYVTKWSWTAFDGNGWTYSNTVNRTSDISDFSSIGPTADGRQKPDIAAPGQGIVSSFSSTFSAPDNSDIMPGRQDYLTQGTSMSAPHVAGAAALLLQISPSLDASQIKSLLTSTAATDTYTGSVPNTRWGYGKMDVLKAAVKAINPQAVLQKQTLAYDNDGTNQVLSPFLTGSTKYAVRFTPGITGQLTGMQVSLTTSPNRPLQGVGPLVCEVWSNVSGSVGGVPGSKLGNTVLQPFARLSVGTNNYIDMTSAGVTVTAGQDYHLVIAVANPQDTVKVRMDAVLPLTNRSSYYDGTSAKWINLVATNSAANFQQNLRIRAMVTSVSGLVSVEPQVSVPNKFKLGQNYPNPFNPTTTIRYSVPVQTRVRLRVFDLIGREVASLVDEEEVSGNYVVTWHGTDNNGKPLASGVYFYKLEGSGQQITKKMVLLK
ncbi:MAG: S8 family serine peptidase [Bacteroidota bacterium]